MAFKTNGVVRINNAGGANFGITTATEFDGKVSEKAITEQTDGDETNVTGADEVLIYDNQTAGLLRVTVDEFIEGAGIGTIVSEFNSLTVSGVGSIIAQTFLGDDINNDAGATVHALGILYPEAGIVIGEVGGLEPSNANIRSKFGDTAIELQLNESMDTFDITYKQGFGAADTLISIDAAAVVPIVSVGCSIIPDTNITYDLGSPTNRFRDIYLDSVTLGSGGPVWSSGTGTPEGSLTAPVGSLYSRTDGGADTTLYVKESGTGNTGWAAK